ASKIAQEASIRSLMFGENEVRFNTAPISSAIDSSALRNTSRVIGSTSGFGALRRVTPGAGASFILGSRCQGSAAGDRAAGDAAVDDELSPCDVARRVGGEEQNPVGDVLR